jgi:hypothetical protein
MSWSLTHNVIFAILPSTKRKFLSSFTKGCAYDCRDLGNRELRAKDFSNQQARCSPPSGHTDSRTWGKISTLNTPPQLHRSESMKRNRPLISRWGRVEDPGQLKSDTLWHKLFCHRRRPGWKSALSSRSVASSFTYIITATFNKAAA